MRRNRKIKIIIGIIICISLIFTYKGYDYSYAFAQNVETHSQAVINKLIEQRAKLLSEMLISNKSIRDEQKKEIQEIDDQLVAHGAEFLTWDEVKKKYKVNDENSKASVPSSSYNVWISSRYTYTNDGATYNIQKLVAQPDVEGEYWLSPLSDIGTRVISSTRNWVAGIDNMIKSLAMSSVGSIPSANMAVTVYTALSAFISGISTTTEVSGPQVSYTWSSVTTASFMYVRRTNQTDDDQELSMISTKTVTAVECAMPSIRYRNSGESWVSVPQIEETKRTIYATPSGFERSLYAVRAFQSGGVEYQCVRSIQISGPESISVENIYPCYPSFPAHCE